MTRRTWRKTCGECGNTFDRQHPKARYCSERCRARAMRARQRIRGSLYSDMALECALRQIYSRCLTGKAISSELET